LLVGAVKEIDAETPDVPVATTEVGTPGTVAEIVNVSD
jgi:hypothetical protein